MRCHSAALESVNTQVRTFATDIGATRKEHSVRCAENRLIMTRSGLSSADPVSMRPYSIKSVRLTEGEDASD